MVMSKAEKERLAKHRARDRKIAEHRGEIVRWSPLGGGRKPRLSSDAYHVEYDEYQWGTMWWPKYSEDHNHAAKLRRDIAGETMYLQMGYDPSGQVWLEYEFMGGKTFLGDDEAEASAKAWLWWKESDYD